MTWEPEQNGACYAVTAQDLSKRYGRRTALDRFTVHIPFGCIAGVLGPNGSGKSTFFRTLAGLVRPDAGEVRVLGETPGWQAMRRIAYLPDRARWYAGHRVEDALRWAARLWPGFARDVAEELLVRMDLEPAMDVSGMSRGEEARLMLALCLARQVPLYILDEPFTGIDILSRERILSALIEMASRREMTVLLSTHEIGEVEGVLDYAVFVRGGRVVLAGAAEDIRADQGSMVDVYRRLFAERGRRHDGPDVR
ncbi:ABC transporter [Alicyclobacillus cellulosilyticus]|uniref:ABC transporter n=1 Tax=Alicyclobacillus cellulosilyticus TaxID=1003997 RepID=A0A917NIC4_9BACL|nr:ABC transporter ATP-binding protein [Alicyclobacillus cellulosilyticus]GGJ02681.1 ABC transporter [Alicyclobacillus cellulosilyticus]